MKRLFLVLSIVFILSSVLPAQARTNAELAIVTDTGRELANVQDWYKNSANQWKTTEILPRKYGYNGISHFNKLKLYTVSYKNIDYILFEIVIKDLDYEYPTIRENRFYFRKSRFYIIENKNFAWKIKENIAYKNQLYAILNGMTGRIGNG